MTAKIDKFVSRPVRLECDVKNRGVKIYIMISGRWTKVKDIPDFVNPTHLEVEDLIFEALSNAGEEKKNLS